MLLLMSLSTACLAQNHKGQAQEEVDIDEWQVMRVAASKDPFERSRQFSINFADYAQEDWCYPLPGGKVISPFGGSRRHGGTDIKTRPNDTIRAAFPGEVIAPTTPTETSSSSAMPTDWRQPTATTRATW